MLEVELDLNDEAKVDEAVKDLFAKLGPGKVIIRAQIVRTLRASQYGPIIQSLLRLKNRGLIENVGVGWCLKAK